jgi:hypothetical protein
MNLNISIAKEMLHLSTKFYSRNEMVKMKMVFAFVLATLLIGFSCVPLGSAQTVVTEEIGNDSTTGMDSIGNGVRGQYARASGFTAGYYGDITKVGINVATPVGNISTAIYADDFGNPGALLAYSDPAAAVSGWNDLTLNTSVSVTTGTFYWLAFNNDNDTLDTYREADTGEHVYVSWTFGSFPDPFGTVAGTRPFTPHMRVTYATDPPPNPVPEGLTFGVMLLLSTVATIAGMRILRKRQK